MLNIIESESDSNAFECWNFTDLKALREYLIAYFSWYDKSLLEATQSHLSLYEIFNDENQLRVFIDISQAISITFLYFAVLKSIKRKQIVDGNINQTYFPLAILNWQAVNVGVQCKAYKQYNL